MLEIDINLIKNTLFYIMYFTFIYGAFAYIRNHFRLGRYFKRIGDFGITSDELSQISSLKSQDISNFCIFVPARNEADVIENTINNLLLMNYPKDKYRIVIIVDERERDDNVPVLTLDIVNRVALEAKVKYGHNIVQCIEVPKWYSGVFDSSKKTFNKSTKGRALNYALQVLNNLKKWKSVDYIGVLDADGRMHANVLKEVAFKSMIYGGKIFQGPVFQISNLRNVNIIGVFAALELALHHITDMTHRLINNRFNFLAGTNYFIKKDLIVDCGGWDQDALVEDAEIAMRIYIQKNEKTIWLSSPEIEQTPKNFAIYRKQRERWVRGHFDLIPMVWHSKLNRLEKYKLVERIIVSQFRFILDILFPIVALVYIIFSWVPHMSFYIFIISVILFVLSFMSWNIYSLTYRRVLAFANYSISPRERFKKYIILFILSPIVPIVQGIPRVSALYKYIFKINKGVWYKTERTKEIVIKN